jgi:hypothetical protein
LDIKLFEPYELQYNILDALLDPNIFNVIAVLGRQVGKTLLAENIISYWAINDPGCVIFFVSPTDSQNLRIFRDIIDALWASGCIKSKKQGRGGMEIVFKNGSKILFRSAASEDSLRGPSVEYMILDEAAFIKKDTIQTILLPMLAVKGKKVYVSTTPKGKNWVYEWFLKGQSDKNPKWKSFRYSSYDSPHASQDMIQEFRDELPEKLFQQEVEAQFIDSASVFNNVEELMTISTLESPIPGKKYWAGIDIGLVNDATVITILDEDGNLVKYYRWKGIESPDLIEEILNVNRIWNFQKIMIENNNQGLNIFQDLKRKIRNIVDFNTNSRTKPEIINNLVHLFNMKEIQLMKDGYLRTELEAFICTPSGAKLTFEAASGFHDDIVMALCIARECFSKYRYTGMYHKAY